MRTAITFIYILFLLLACVPPEQAATPISASESDIGSLENESLDPIEAVEKAHAKAEFLSHDAISFDIRLSFGGKERLNGRMTLATNSSKGLIEYSNGDRLIFDEDKVYHNEDMERSASARFAAYTWSYFFLFPYKLSDPGTNWSPRERQKLNENTYNHQMLTFEAGTGDAPDDWYKMYSDPETGLIQVAAYIVTASSTTEEAELDPHAIKYENYSNVSGIPIASQWTFWEWRENGGLTRQLGEASLSNIAFGETSDDSFKPKESYIEK